MAAVMFDTDKFIVEIQKHPAIYDFTNKEYLDKNAKILAWEMVSEAMVPKWCFLSDELKKVEEKLLRSKWRNIRDYFMKELKAQKLQKNKVGGKKRKKYMYYEQLKFLLPYAEIKKNKKNMRSKNRPQTKHEEIDIESDPLQTPSSIEDQYDMQLAQDSLSEGYPNDDTNNVDNVAANDPLCEFPKSICEASMATASEVYPNAVAIEPALPSNPSVVDQDDYDKMFLLSLLPIMRKLPEDKKLDVRIQMQQVIAQALKGNTS